MIVVAEPRRSVTIGGRWRRSQELEARRDAAATILVVLGKQGAI